MVANPDELKRQIQAGYEAGFRAAASQADNECVKAGCSCTCAEEPEIRPDGLRIWQVKEEKAKLEAVIKLAFERFTAKTGFAVTYVDIDVDTEDYPLPSYEEVKVTIQL